MGNRAEQRRRLEEEMRPCRQVKRERAITQNTVNGRVDGR